MSCTVTCTECGETREGLRIEDSSVPIEEECPTCGGRFYTDIVDAPA